MEIDFSNGMTIIVIDKPEILEGKG